MVFANGGIAQIAGEPGEVLQDFSNAFRLLKNKITNEISSEEADFAMVLIGRLSVLTPEQEMDFFTSLGGGNHNFRSLSEKLDVYLAKLA